MQKINTIQFLPYFPPHKWWLETVAEEFSKFYVAKDYGEVINVVFDVGQNEFISKLSSSDLIRGSNKSIPIWYKQKWYIVYLLPAFDLISNFPVPKFWKKEFWEILTSPLAPLLIGDGNKDKIIVQTHTRFFLSSLLWWLFSKYHKLKWVHVEHWSDYVKLWSKIKSKIAYIYDRIIWKWIFKNSDKIVAISEWVRKFVLLLSSSDLIRRSKIIESKIDFIYNWIKFSPWNRVDNWDIIKIWFVWRLVKLKWVELLINSFKNLQKKYPNIILEIVWDWDEKKYLESISWENIKFLWFQSREYIANIFLPTVDILINPSFQEWLPTTVLEWLLSWCVVVATDVWGTKDISDEYDLIIVEKWNVLELEKWLEKAILNYESLRWKSRDYVKERFDWDKVVDEYFNLYRNL